jgi:hypothetical protein
MTSITPENMILEEIKEQLALYNRLYYQKKHDKDFMETKRASTIRYNRRKKLDKKAENGKIELKNIDYEENKENTEEDKNKVKATKPRKYKGNTMKILNVE